MTSGAEIVNPAQMAAADARASTHMKDGIRLLEESDGNAMAAIRCFDRALELRRCLPTAVATTRTVCRRAGSIALTH
jgi:hypothetical protein